MKKFLSFTIVFTAILTLPSQAQVLSKQSAAGVILRSLDKKLPEIINNNSPVENFKVDAIKIRRSHVKLKGNFTVKTGKTQVFDKPFRVKSRIATKLSSPDVVQLRVHIPGDKFLFFRRYRKLL